MAHPGVMVPFVGMIPGGAIPGKRISVHGMVVPSCNRFSINLQCGPNCNPRDDIAMHMNFRYDQQVPYVVRNSLQMQQWGLEEGHGYLSFGRGHNFEVLIQVEHDHFKVFFNGQHFTEFRYRMPSTRVTYITIDGEVVIHAVKVDGYDIHTASMQRSASPYGPSTMPMAGQAPGPYGFGAPRGMGGMHPPTMAVVTGPPVSHMYPGYPTAGVHPTSAAIPVHGAAVMTGATTMMYGAHMSKDAKKAAKKHKKEMKKAMKHHKHAKHSSHYMHGYSHHGHHHKSSSSSSSSSEEE